MRETSEEEDEWEDEESEEEEEGDVDIDDSADEIDEAETTSEEDSRQSDSETDVDGTAEKGNLKNAGRGTPDIPEAIGSDAATFAGEFSASASPLDLEIANDEEWAEWESKATSRLLFQKWR